jgi:hypothetical protein
MVRKTNFCTAAVVFMLALSAGISFAGPGEVKWTSYYQGSEENGQVSGIACHGNNVYAAGFNWDLDKTIAESRPTLVLYKADTGATSTITLFENAGGLINSIKTDSKNVYAAGQYLTGTQWHAFVDAYSLKGEEVWERLWLDSGERNASDMALYQNKVVTAGTDSGNSFNVTVLGASKGRILWENSSEMTGRANAVTANSGRVFAVGRYDDRANYRTLFVVRAYDMSTGSLLWEDVQGTAGVATSQNYSEAYAVAANASRVYVAGTLFSKNNPGGGAAFAVHAYDTKTGAPIWRDNFDLFSYFDDAANAVYLSGNKLFVGGYVTRMGGGRAFTVRAYNAVSGKSLWTSIAGGYYLEDNSAKALSVAGNRLYAAGAATKDPYTGFATKAYDISKGTLLWEDQIDNQVPATFSLTPMANTICATGSGIFAGGTSSVAGKGQAFTVRANAAR